MGLEDVLSQRELIYQSTLAFGAVSDAFIAHFSMNNSKGLILLFVKSNDEPPIPYSKLCELRAWLKIALSKEYVPDVIIEVSDIPHDRSGEKLEPLVSALISGQNINFTDFDIDEQNVGFLNFFRNLRDAIEEFGF